MQPADRIDRYRLPSMAGVAGHALDYAIAL
jgi:hypothetical protein